VSTLYRGGPIYAEGNPTALLVDRNTISWLGSEIDAPAAETVVDVNGGWLAPAFVDAHVHATSSGLALTGLDLGDAPSLVEAMARLELHARHGRGAPILGAGWDETRWPERRAPTRVELDRASYGGLVYLPRIDMHSAVVSSALLATVPDVASRAGFRPDGLVTLDAHHACRQAARQLLTPRQRQAAQSATLARAAAHGIGCLHEMAGPDVSSEADLRGLLDLAAADPAPEVIGYWADLGDVETAARLGLRGGAGDLFVDGTIGSRTAALHEPYADTDGPGSLRYDAEAIADHVIACVQAGQQPGFHVIGDRAVEAVLDGLELAAARVGAAELRAARPRLEHVEMAGPAAVQRLAALGGVASVQPAFDALWGGERGMYAARLGADRARPMNPLAAFAAAGVPLAFGSDAPVTPIDPWGGVRAAVQHRTDGAGLLPTAAFTAATAGGWTVARVDGGGVLRVGAKATFAVWALAGTLTPDGLPDLTDPDPECQRTVVAGRTIYSATPDAPEELASCQP
jgi:predicted amidohydrolase YtcJ